MNKYIVMGVQGSGKGTQAKMLKEYLGLVHISVGDVFRWNIQSHTKLGARVKRLISEGQLVPDEVVDEVVRDRLDEHDWNFGFILDGFPRSRRQAEFFLESYDIDAVILIDVPDSIVMERVLSRLLCLHCGLDYNLIYHRPVRENVCDVCAGELVRRSDDNEASIKARLKDYHEKTAPIIDLFSKKELVIRVDGTKPAEAVQQHIRRELKTPRQPALLK